jgi:hypothetical protein
MTSQPIRRAAISIAATAVAVVAVAVPAHGAPVLDPDPPQIELPPANTAQATVNVRVESDAWTALRQTVTVKAGEIDMPGGIDYTQPSGYQGGSHICDGRNGSNPNGYTHPVPTPVRALAAATQAAGVTWYAPFDAAADDFTSIYRIGSDSADNAVGPFFSVHVNGVDVTDLGCKTQLVDGDEVVFSRGGFGQPVLKVAGPSVAYIGESAEFKVTDTATGEPIAGAKINGASTDSTGHVKLTFKAAGTREVRAEKYGAAIRSAGVQVCVDARLAPKCKTETGEAVLAPPAPTKTEQPSDQPKLAPLPEVCETNGNDGRCGTQDGTAPQVRISVPQASIGGVTLNQGVFRLGRAPRIFSGRVGVPYGNGLEPEQLKMTKARLTRSYKGRCSYYSPKSETLREMKKCGAKYARFFKLGTTPEWTLTLPGSLPRGRYVLDVNAVDMHGNRDWPTRRTKGKTNSARRGQNRFVFHIT